MKKSYLTVALLTAAAAQAQDQADQTITEPGSRRLGHALALSGDRLAVADDIGPLVRMYRRTGAQWFSDGTISPTSNTNSFGVALDLEDDVLVVGAPLHDAHPASAIPSGLVYVYRRLGIGWTLEATLPPPVASAGDDSMFGSSYGARVAIHENWIAVGAPNYLGTGSEPDGAVFLFRRTGGSWSLASSLPLQHPQKAVQHQERFGSSLAWLDDALVVGVFGDDGTGGPGANHGAVFLFPSIGLPSGAGPLKIVAPGPPVNDAAFGWSVDTDGDLLVVGAPNLGTGAAYLFRRAVGVWNSGMTLPSPSLQGDALFGYSVSVSSERIVVGAPNKNGSSFAPGFAQEYEVANGSISTTQLLPQAGVHTIQQTDHFGASVATSTEAIVVGAPNTSQGTTSFPGAVYSWNRMGPSCQVVDYCDNPSNSTGVGARLEVLGSTRFADNDFRLRAWDLVPDQFGIFCYSAGQMHSPLGDGFLCVDSPQYRVPTILSSNAQGEAALQIDLQTGFATQGPGAISPGSTWNFQYWYRDPGAQHASMRVNLTQAVAVTFCN